MVCTIPAYEPSYDGGRDLNTDDVLEHKRWSRGIEIQSLYSGNVYSLAVDGVRLPTRCVGGGAAGSYRLGRGMVGSNMGTFLLRLESDIMTSNPPSTNKMPSLCFSRSL